MKNWGRPLKCMRAGTLNKQLSLLGLSHALAPESDNALFCVHRKHHSVATTKASVSLHNTTEIRMYDCVNFTVALCRHL